MNLSYRGRSTGGKVKNTPDALPTLFFQSQCGILHHLLKNKNKLPQGSFLMLFFLIFLACIKENRAALPGLLFLPGPLLVS